MYGTYRQYNNEFDDKIDLFKVHCEPNIFC